MAAFLTVRNIVVHLEGFEIGKMYKQTSADEFLNRFYKISIGNSPLVQEVINSEDILYFRISYLNNFNNTKLDLFIKGDESYYFEALNPSSRDQIESYRKGLNGGSLQTNVYLSSSKKNYGLTDIKLMNYQFNDGIVTMLVYFRQYEEGYERLK